MSVIAVPCSYVHGPYDTPEGYQKLAGELAKREASFQGPAGRLFYLALPPPVYPEVCKVLLPHETLNTV